MASLRRPGDMVKIKRQRDEGAFLRPRRRLVHFLCGKQRAGEKRENQARHANPQHWYSPGGTRHEETYNPSRIVTVSCTRLPLRMTAAGTAVPGRMCPAAR